MHDRFKKKRTRTPSALSAAIIFAVAVLIAGLISALGTPNTPLLDATHDDPGLIPDEQDFYDLQFTETLTIPLPPYTGELHFEVTDPVSFENLSEKQEILDSLVDLQFEDTGKPLFSVVTGEELKLFKSQTVPSHDLLILQSNGDLYFVPPTTAETNSIELTGEPFFSSGEGFASDWKAYLDGTKRFHPLQFATRSQDTLHLLDVKMSEPQIGRYLVGVRVKRADESATPSAVPTTSPTSNTSYLLTFVVITNEEAEQPTLTPTPTAHVTSAPGAEGPSQNSTPGTTLTGSNTESAPPTLSPTPDSSSVTPGCGNGIREDDEECDDGYMCDGITPCCPEGANCSSSLPKTCPVILGATDQKCERRNDDRCTNECKIGFCGDGIVSAILAEACDDGGVCSNDSETTCTAHSDCPGGECLPQNNDGCDENCQEERCGNGVIQPHLGETCDRGSRCEFDSLDCSADSESCPDLQNNRQQRCLVVYELGCSGCRPSCGDGIPSQSYGEECDPGSTCRGSTDSNGEPLNCTKDPSVCTFQGRPYPQDCMPTANEDCTADCKGKCGNGEVDDGESCDPGRSCSNGLDCTRRPDNCATPDDCQVRPRNNCDINCERICGNGVVDTDAGEDCDLGFEHRCAFSGEPCDPNDRNACPGFFGEDSCIRVTSTTCDTNCRNRCGDRYKDESEMCDPPEYTCADGTPCDPNRLCNDISECKVRAGAKCDEECHHRCGNMIVEEGEQCDEGSQCARDFGQGYEFHDPPIDCTGWPERCKSTGFYRYCVPFSGGECDKDCQYRPRCGDGVTDSNGADNRPGGGDDEDCDNGGVCASGESCTHNSDCEEGECRHNDVEDCRNCKLAAFCGDGTIQPFGADGIEGTSDDEECDDGKQCSLHGTSCSTVLDCLDSSCQTHSLDGCTSECKNEYCGDGVVQHALGEQCDPEKTRCCNSSGDCSHTCSVDGDCDPLTERCRRPHEHSECNWTCQLVCGNGNRDPGEDCDPGSFCPDGSACTAGFNNPCANGAPCLPANTESCTDHCVSLHACCQEGTCSMKTRNNCNGKISFGKTCREVTCFATPGPTVSATAMSSQTPNPSGTPGFQSSALPGSTPN